jgi:hypothetical protein
MTSFIRFERLDTSLSMLVFEEAADRSVIAWFYCGVDLEDLLSIFI